MVASTSGMGVSQKAAAPKMVRVLGDLCDRRGGWGAWGESWVGDYTTL